MRKFIEKILRERSIEEIKKMVKTELSPIQREIFARVEMGKYKRFIKGGKLFSELESDSELSQKLIELYGDLAPFESTCYIIGSKSQHKEELLKLRSVSDEYYEKLLEYAFQTEDVEAIDKLLRYKAGTHYLSEDYEAEKKTLRERDYEKYPISQSENRYVVLGNYPVAHHIKRLMSLHGKIEAEHREPSALFERHLESAVVGEYGPMYNYVFANLSDPFFHKDVDKEICQLWHSEGKEQAKSMQ